jgi:hypothetical protein
MKLEPMREGCDDLRAHRDGGRDQPLAVRTRKHHTESVGNADEIEFELTALFSCLAVPPRSDKRRAHAAARTCLEDFRVDRCRCADEDEVGLILRDIIDATKHGASEDLGPIAVNREELALETETQKVVVRRSPELAGVCRDARDDEAARIEERAQPLERRGHGATSSPTRVCTSIPPRRGLGTFTAMVGASIRADRSSRYPWFDDGREGRHPGARIAAVEPSNTNRQTPARARAVRSRARLRRSLLVLIAVLFVASVPWYRASGELPAVVLGLPDWVAVALGCYVGVAVFNAIAWALTDVPDVPSPDAEDGV